MSTIQKEWMDLTDRCPIYLNGVVEFIEFAKKNNHGLSTCPCPCKKCRNRKRWSFDEVERHLCTWRIDPSYRVWHFHGEKQSKALFEDETKETNDNENESIVDGGLGIGNFVDASYGLYEMQSDVYSDAIDVSKDFEETYVPEPDLGKRYTEYKKKAEEKLYPGCEGPETTLSAIIELQNLKQRFGWSGASVTALLSTLKKWFPEGNTLPHKYPVMKAMVKDLGMKATCIHACENNCILYWKEHENKTKCPQCDAPRFKEIKGISVKQDNKGTKEPNKVLRHFPLIPRLKRLYTIPWIARDMTWHGRAKSSWDNMRHPSDSAHWNLFDEKWPDFAKEMRNVRLGISTDGFNPRGEKSASYSCWPVITVPYNLPPSLCMKSEFQMLSLLIPGPKAPGKDIDVFLQPLVDELMELWEGEGVPAYDMHKREYFMLRAILMWGIHDLPAYGYLSGCVVQGYKACAVCGDDTESIWLTNGRKVVYLNYRRFLRMDHPFRSGRFLGLKTIEDNPPPKRLNGQPLLQQLNKLNYVPGKLTKGAGKKKNRVVLNEGDDYDEATIVDDAGNNNGNDMEDDDDDVTVTAAYYKKSILFKLKYWIDHPIRHEIDVMHVEKNFAEHLLNTILDKRDKTKDTFNSREDMKKMGIHSGQWLKIDKSTGKPTKPKAPFLLEGDCNQHFFKILKDMKTPSGFSSNLSNCVTLEPPKLLGSMKSHDYHVIMCYLLPVLLQHAFPKHRDLRRAIHQISLFFNLLCSKVLIRQEIQEAKYMVVEAFCVLEKHFPPSFFDISVHLVVHLADEALCCGPTGFRWMFPLERSMLDHKDIPSNRRYVEGSIAENYIVSESVRYAMEYMPNPRDGNHKATHEAFLDEDGEYNDEGPLLDGKPMKLSPEQWLQIRRWVLFRLDVDGLDEYYSEYKLSLQPISRGKGKRTAKKEVEIQTDFIPWLYDKLLKAEATDSVLWRLVKGPLHQVKTYRKYRVNGYVFSPRSYDDTVATQDSGVSMRAITTFTSSGKDKNPIDASYMYYGYVNHIMELDYTDFSQVVFYCDWVRVEDRTNGYRICPDSHLELVNFDRLKSVKNILDEPAILASDASQVFYSKDLQDPNWWVVIHSPKRLTSLVDQLDEPTVFQSTLRDQPNLRVLLEPYR